MEETWKTISLSPLRRSPTSTTAAAENSFLGLDLLDLFSIPCHKDSSTSRTTSRTYDHHHHPPSSSAARSQGGAAVNGCSSPPLTTVLSDQIHTSSSPPFVSSMEFSVLPCSNAMFPSPPSKRRVLDHDDGYTDSGGERFKRLMKCRESGDRSRGRAQAYLEQLEKEQRQLKKENAKIRRELQKVGEISQRSQKKHFRVRRSSTAPL